MRICPASVAGHILRQVHPSICAAIRICAAADEGARSVKKLPARACSFPKRARQHTGRLRDAKGNHRQERGILLCARTALGEEHDVVVLLAAEELKYNRGSRTSVSTCTRCRITCSHHTPRHTAPARTGVRVPRRCTSAVSAPLSAPPCHERAPRPLLAVGVA